MERSSLQWGDQCNEYTEESTTIEWRGVGEMDPIDVVEKVDVRKEEAERDELKLEADQILMVPSG